MPKQSLTAELQGESIRLTQLSLEHLDGVVAMLAEPESNRLTGTTETFTRERLQEWCATRAETADRADWAIVDRETGEFLGEVVLNELIAEKQSMNIRIALAHPSLYGLGIGGQAFRLVLTHAFDTLKLEQVTLSVLVDNARAKALYHRMGFRPGREYNDRKLRYLRMKLTKLDFVEARSRALMSRHLSAEQLASWAFTFDSGKRRAGACNYDKRQISLSRYYAYLHSIEQSEQVMLHELAHALCGPKVGHGAAWKAKATELGYRHERLDGAAVGEFAAPWVGECPNGHLYYRYRRPTKPSSCSRCHRGGYSEAFRIKWQQR